MHASSSRSNPAVAIHDAASVASLGPAHPVCARRAAALAMLIALAAGCSGPADADAADAAADAADEPDASADPDAESGVPLAGFGDISGTCGAIDLAVIDGAEPALVRNAIDFGARPYTDDDLAQLTAGGQEIFLDGNAGGSSLYSEMFAFEVLARCELATLRKTETEIAYDAQGAITDFLIEAHGRKVGVSVTRAFAFPPENPYTVPQARALLDDKLADVLESSANVSAEDRWVVQILHVIAYEPMHAESVMTAYAEVDPAIRADTIVVVTVSDGDDAFLY